MKSFWLKAIPHVLTKKRARLDIHYKNQRVGIDILNWLQEDQYNFREVVQCISKGNKFYEPKTIIETIARRHSVLVKANVIPIYVFPGTRHPHQLIPIRIQNAIQNLNDFSHRAKANDISEDYERRAAMMNARNVGVTDPRIINFLGRWMIDRGMHCIQAPFEVSWQLVEMERQGLIYATISNDDDCVALGSKQLLVKTTYGKDPKCYQFLGEVDFVKKPHSKFDLTPYRNHLPELVTMLGSKYLPVPVGRDSDYIVKQRLPKYFEALRDGKGFRFWQKQNLDRDYVHRFQISLNLLRYCPVLRQRPDSKTLDLVPLNPLPDDNSITWETWLGFDPVGLLPVPPEHYTSAANFQDGFTFATKTSLDDWCRDCTPILLRYRRNPRS